MHAAKILLTAAGAGVFFGTVTGTAIGADPKRPVEPAWPHLPSPPNASGTGYQFTESAPEDLTPPWTLDNPRPLYSWQINTAEPDYVPPLAEYRPEPIPDALPTPGPVETPPAVEHRDEASGEAVPPSAEQMATADRSSVSEQAVTEAVGRELWSSAEPRVHADRGSLGVSS